MVKVERERVAVPAPSRKTAPPRDPKPNNRARRVFVSMDCSMPRQSVKEQDVISKRPSMSMLCNTTAPQPCTTSTHARLCCSASIHCRSLTEESGLDWEAVSSGIGRLPSAWIEMFWNVQELMVTLLELFRTAWIAGAVVKNGVMEEFEGSAVGSAGMFG